MKVSASALAAFAATATVVHAFQPIQYASLNTRRSPLAATAGDSSDDLGLFDRTDLAEFDYLMGETAQPNQTPVYSRRRIHLQDDQQTVLTSTTFAGPATTEESLETDETAAVTEGEYDPYADVGVEAPHLQKLQPSDMTFSQKFENRLKNMDLQDVISTLIIPSIALYAAGKWGYTKVSGKVGESADATLDAFASELIYHDGDFEEMKMCVSDYSKKLMWLGPTKTNTMLKRYLALYAKKRTVSPQAISSLSYTFSLFKLTEAKVAEILVSLCRDMGETKISSAGKILFFGSHILKSPEGKAALEPIKSMIMATYRDEEVAETLVETSQRAMGEAAYRSTVLAAGKDQKSLTPGWEVLGLDKETATRIFEDEAEEGFVTDREQMYKGQSTKYDKAGNAIDKEGKLIDPENAIKPKEEEEPTSNVYECGECGYTLFIAKGRETKFYGDDFKCPECGAAKDKFNARDDMDE